MVENELINHLRDAHGFVDYEPGGAGHEQGRRGFIAPLNEWGDGALDSLHLEDHQEIPGGGGPDKHEHGEE